MKAILPHHRSASLAQMKAMALGLLLLSAVIYVLATLLEPRHAAWSYVAAAAEAAMIGALADWFAVVALFRHPLGLPIPHTAIIVANKDQLGAQLARFLGDHFLLAEHLRRALARWDLAHELALWLVRPEAARRLSQWLQRLVPAVLDVLDQTPARHWVAALAQRLLRELDLAALGGQALAALTAQGHHQQWLDGLLRQLAQWAEQEPTQERLTEAIARELKELKYLGLDQVAARLATRKLVAALSRTLSEVAQDPQHELRARFDDWMNDSIQRLQNDPDWQARVALWRDTWLAQPDWREPVEAWWHELLEQLRAESSQPGSALGERIALLAQASGQHLLADAALRDWLNRQAQYALLRVLRSGRETMVAFVTQRVQAWDAQEMSRVLENHIGRDLQFIRINGTLVGALVGLLVHSLTEAALAWPLVQAWMQP
ncbi:DUF445 domain-containing protein [Hydrogenophaga sp.]|uniref:DUF445 domain-containing protein n=1 Tax=Hydrogenophaga sp. TaxID=1904254 RepID=UPI0019AFC17D|nr:DUF445 domain-containing protein [Hydrogenophaga sp.]MBD3892567.1 DUF445 domain-containing protein [Hydrogenophaga sp.]